MRRGSEYRLTPDGLIFSSAFKLQFFARGGRVTTNLQPQNHGLDNPRAKFCFQNGVALAAYILGTFPVVHRHDKATVGHDRTKSTVLAYYNPLAAGDTDTDVAARPSSRFCLLGHKGGHTPSKTTN